MNPIDLQTARHLPGGGKQLGQWSKGNGGKGRIWHPTMGRGRLVAPDNTILWRGDWEENALHDEGEKNVLDVYFGVITNPQKYLALAAQGSVTALADTVIFTGITEAETPGTDAYARQEITSGEWATATLDSGDYQRVASVQTFGANSGTGAWSVSHTILTLASTGTGGLLIISVPLSSVQSVAQGIAFTHELTVKAQ